MDQVTAESAVFVIVLTRHFAMLVFTRGLSLVDTRRLQLQFQSSEQKLIQSKCGSCEALLTLPG